MTLMISPRWIRRRRMAMPSGRNLRGHYVVSHSTDCRLIDSAGNDKRMEFVAHRHGSRFQRFECRLMKARLPRKDPQILPPWLADHRPLVVLVQGQYPIIRPDQWQP